MSPTTAGTSKMYEPIDVEATLSKMTVSEKIQVTAGEDFWHFKGIERLGVPSPRCSDGPNGVRGQTIFNGCSSSCFPGGTAFGAMFDKELIYRIAAALGDECKAKGVHFLLGPTVNMQRHPFGGRAFESIAEDPHLSGAMAASYLQGLQSTGVGGCIKHLVANDQEHDRFASDSRISERALREIYLEPFRIAIKDGKPASLMTAYNKVNGQHASSSTHLLKTILRDEWQYDGIVMSDWSGIYALRESYEATLDIEMPGPAVVRGLPQVLRAINGNDVSPSKHLDPIVRRYLNFCNRAIASGIPFNAPETTLDTPEIRALLRECAAESIVLLKNDAKLLPLGQASFGKNKRQIALLGNNANKGLGLGGGSSSLLTTYTVSPLEALTESASKLNVDVKFAIGAPTHVLLPIIDPDMTLPDGSGKKALLVELFADEPPLADWLTSSRIAIPASKVPALRVPSNSASVMFWDGLPGDLMSHKVFGKITMNWMAPESGDWEFGVASIGYTTLFVEDELIVEINPETFVQGETFYGFASEERKGLVRGVEAGRTYRLELRLSPSLEMESMPWTTAGAARIGAFRVQTPQEALDEAVALAAESDVAVVVVGLSPEYESEGFDRKTLSLPGDSDKLIEAVLAVQPNTVVVNQSGTPVAMPWIAKASTVIHAFYAGNESGNGLADILFGTRNPSAKLPISFPIRQSDILADTSFAEKSESAHAVLYNEGVVVGYRNYEKRRMEVLFPFGHGLSYATFTYSDLEVHAFDGATNGIYADVTVQVRNDGEVAGSEAVQLYVAPKSSRISRPVKELKAFAKLALAPGESKTASFRLEKEAFSYFDEDENCWIAEAVEYHILVGSSSADIRAKGQYQLEEEVRWTGL